jgi:hypothetical protein
MSVSYRWFLAVFGSVIAFLASTQTSSAAISLNFSDWAPSFVQLKKATPSLIPKNLRGKHKVFFAVIIDRHGIHPLNGDFQDRASITIGGKITIVTPAGQRLRSKKILETYLVRYGIYFSNLEGKDTILIHPKKAHLLDLLKGESSEFFANAAFRKCTSAELRSINVYWIGYHFRNPVSLLFFVEI